MTRRQRLRSNRNRRYYVRHAEEIKAKRRAAYRAKVLGQA